MDRLLDNVFSFRGPKSLGYVSIPSEIYLLSNCDTHHDSETGFGTRVLSFRNDNTLVPKPVSLSWCVSQFDNKYISDGILTYPKDLGPLNENTLSNNLSI